MIPSKLTQAATNKAVAAASNALKNEAVRQQLREAPDAIARWAKTQRAALDERRASGDTPAWLEPLARFGQSGLQRRLDALEANVELAFAAEDDPGRVTILRAVLELQKALVVSSSLPLMRRKRVQMRIDSEIAELEEAVVEAVLPSSRQPDS